VEGEEDYEYENNNLEDLGAIGEGKRATTSMQRERTVSQNVFNNDSTPIQ
tara:strand:- start:882 stop:1031 length:150 start_codon:yes stop_codon:yes gene_type:complete